MNNVGSLSEMVNSSIVVLSRPSVSTFEMYERRGNLQNALIYVAIGALISGVLGLIGGGFLGLVGGIIGALIGFVVFTYAVFFIGKSQGGTGTYDEVAYTFSLFNVPLTIIGAVLSMLVGLIPPLVCLAAPISLLLVAANIYLGYLAVQSSMNLRDSGKAIITLLAAGVILLIVNFVIGAIFVGGAAATGALNR
jgi:hypothetical protein